MVKIPLFPLRTVLFPGMPLPLHIFEERYKQMIAACLAAKSSFGVALIRHGAEALGPLAEPYLVGCTARITKVEILDEGRYSLVAVGEERFRILSLETDLPYLVGEIEAYPLRECDAAAMKRAEQNLLPWFKRYLHAVVQEEDLEDSLENIPHDPQAFAYLASVLLQIPVLQKQPLLEAQDGLVLFQQLEDIYRREVALIESLRSTPQADHKFPFSMN
jgi:Lon protease-like protein